MNSRKDKLKRFTSRQMIVKQSKDKGKNLKSSKRKMTDHIQRKLNEINS